MDEHRGIGIAVPGPWHDRSELVRAIAASNEAKALFAGLILMDVERKRHVELQVYDRDDDLVRAMTKGSANAFDEATLAAIGDHVILPVLRFEAGGDDLAERLAFFTTAMRKAGGLGVMIEASGVAHPWERWEPLLAKGDPHSLYQALIVRVKGAGELASFGMRQFDLPDALVPANDLEAAWTLADFDIYRWVENPQLKSGHTFSRKADAPRYRLQLVEDARYAKGHHYLNPHGVWHLTRAG